MLLPPIVEKHFGLEKGSKLILVPLETSRMYEIAKNIALVSLCILTLGVLNYLHPELQDHIYYSLFYHKKIIKVRQDLYPLSALMNFQKFKTTLDPLLGWQKPSANLPLLVPAKRKRKLDLDARIKKMLTLFFLALSYKHTSKIQPQLIPQIPNLSSTHGILNNIPYCFALSPGSKNTMEDIAYATSFTVPINNTYEQISCFILMDGHGIQKGQEPINIYIQKNLVTVLKSYLTGYLQEGFSFIGVYEAFKSAFEGLHTSFPSPRSGTTFVGVFFINNLIFCLSIGDSKAYLIDPFVQLPLALPADPAHDYFHKKLQKRGAHIETNRVEGILNMAAAMGDKNITTKQGTAAIKPSMSLIAIPKIWIQSPAYLILSSDGVSDFLSDKECNDIIRDENLFEKKAENLLKAAFRNGSNDNLSSLVIKI